MTGMSHKEFEEALEKFCPEVESIETEEVTELRKALGAIDAES